MRTQKPNFKKAIQKAMDNKEWTMYRLGKESGVHYDAIRRYMNDEQDMSASRLELIFHALGLKIKK